MDKGYARPTSRVLHHNATDAERRALSAKKVAGVRFNRQVPFGPFVCDFAAWSIKLIVVDGGHHGPATDATRTRFLQTKGYRVIQFWNNDVRGTLDGVVAGIERVIGEMMSHMPSPNASRKREGSF